MIRCRLAVCGEVAVLDKGTSNASVVNILQHMQVEGFPIVFPRLGCVFLLERDEGDPNIPDTSVRITIDDDEIHTFPVPFDFQDKPRSTNIVRILGTVFPRPGIAAVRLLHEGEEIGRWEFSIQKSSVEPDVEVEQG